MVNYICNKGEILTKIIIIKKKNFPRFILNAKFLCLFYVHLLDVEYEKFSLQIFQIFQILMYMFTRFFTFKRESFSQAVWTRPMDNAQTRSTESSARQIVDLMLNQLVHKICHVCYRDKFARCFLFFCQWCLAFIFSSHNHQETVFFTR